MDLVRRSHSGRRLLAPVTALLVAIAVSPLGGCGNTGEVIDTIVPDGADDGTAPDVRPDVRRDTPRPDTTGDAGADPLPDLPGEDRADVASDPGPDVAADPAADAVDAAGDAPADLPADGAADLPPDQAADVLPDVPGDPAPDLPTSVCNNGTIETGEVCDGTDVGTATCVTRGFRAGTLRCAAGCLTFDETGCSNVVINEVESNPSPDWVELYNPGPGPADISGYFFTDNAAVTDLTHRHTFPAGTVIPVGGFIFRVEVTDFTFGLGGADSVRLYEPGETIVDEVSWTVHPTGTLARCPDGAPGPLVDVATPSQGTSNNAACPPPASCGNGTLDAGELCDGTNVGAATCQTRGFRAGTLRCGANCLTFDQTGCSNVRINEIESNPNPDWVEFYNPGPGDANLSGYFFTDDSPITDPTHVYTFPAGTIIPAGGFLVRDGGGVDFPFGLGQPDLVRLYEPGGTVIEEVSWTTHAVGTLARCPDGGNTIVDVTAPGTKGASNATSCPP